MEAKAGVHTKSLDISNEIIQATLYFMNFSMAVSSLYDSYAEKFVFHGMYSFSNFLLKYQFGQVIVLLTQLGVHS